MLHHFLHLLRVLWEKRITLFWPIWMAITVIGIVLVVRIVPEHSKHPREPAKPRLRRRWTRAEIFAAAFLFLVFVCYVSGFLVWEDFTYYDNSHYTNSTLVGRNISLQISPQNGRFWPLGHQEFNPLRYITHSIGGYHALRIVQLLFLCTVLLFFDEELSVRARVALILLLLITPSILTSFSGLIYAEANIIVWLVCLLWSVKCFERSRSTGWAIAAVISAQFLLYYKETAFLLLCGFTVGRLLLRCKRADGAGWDFKRLHESESRLDICLTLMVVTYLVYYLAAMFPVFGMGYSEESRLPLTQVIVSYCELDVLVWIFVSVVVARVFLILWKRVTPSPFWDGLALGGVCCFSSYIVLHMESAYYLAPVDFIAVLYLGRLAFFSIKKMGLTVRLCAVGVLCFVLLQECSLSAFRTYERKNVIHAKAEMGRAIRDRYEIDPQSVRRLFFPFTSPFDILEFASYLNYIGVPVEQRSAGLRTTGDVRLAGKTIEKDGPCGYIEFVCHPSKTPEPGDLVVILPDDSTSIDESNSYRQVGSAVLLSYEPYPRIPQWARPFVDCLHVVSPKFSQRPLPDSWLEASVSEWK